MARGGRALFAAVLAGLAWTASTAVAAEPAPVALHWLEQPPGAQATGVSWGVPWPRGTVQKGQTFALHTAEGRTLPVQTWPLAYWPDGSVKWTGHAAVTDRSTAGTISLVPGGSPASAPAMSVRATSSAAGVDIDTGVLQCRIPASGPAFLSGLKIGGRVVAQ